MPRPRLIVLNGPPGCGKSTLARRFAEEHPPALNLDIDRIRDLIGGWRDDPRGGGLLARAIALAAARVHLAAGHDVVVPQFLGRPEFLEALESLGQEAGAEFHEIVLLDSQGNSVSRYVERSRRGAEPAHLVSHEKLERRVGAAELAAMYDRLMSVIAARPRARVVPTHSGQVDRAYRDFLRSLS